MACPRCQKVVSDSDRIVCRGYCGASFHTFCANVDIQVLDLLGLNERNIFWMCDGCADLFSNGHFRSLTTRGDGNPRSSNDPETINSLKDDISKLSDAVATLSAKVDSQPKTPIAPAGFRFNDVVNKASTPKRRRTESTARPAKNRGTNKAMGESIKTVQLNDDLLWIYLSAFDPTTTEQEVLEFVRNCLNLNSDQKPKVVKLVPKGRDISTMRFVSFKVGVSKELKDTALCADSWPDNIYFREFEDRTKNVARIINRSKDQATPAPDGGTIRSTDTPME